MKPLSKLSIGYFDVETTGLLSQTDKIISLALVVMNDGKMKKLYQKFNPGIHIPTKLSKEVHGIYDEDVEESPTFVEFLPKLMRALRTVDLMCAYNAEFDSRFIIHAMDEVMDRTDFPKAILRPWLDPLPIFRREEFAPYFSANGKVLKSKKLESVYAYFMGKRFKNAHNALYDTMALATMHQHLIRAGILPDDVTEHIMYQRGMFK